MLYTILKSLVLPPGGLIVLLLLGFFLMRGVLGRVLIFVATSVLTLTSLPMVAEILMSGLESYPALRPEALTDTAADGILILGGDRYTDAPEYGGDSVGAKTLERLRYGAYLHRRTELPLYVTGGSPPPEDPSMGQLMSKVLKEEFGVTAAGVEDQSLTTEENAVLSARMLERNGIRRVLLVTQAWHMPRAVGAFERAGIEVTPAPTAFWNRHPMSKGFDYRDWLPSASAFLASCYALHEWIGRAWYQLKAPARKPPGGQVVQDG